MAHYDLRSEISRKIGYALAQKYDRLVFRAITRGARAASPITKANFVEPGGTQIRVGANNQASDAYVPASLVNAFYDAAAAMDEKGVSSDGRVGILNPRQYYELIQQVGDNGLVNRDEQGSSRQKGNGIVEIAGIKIYKSMNIPFFGSYGTKYGSAGAANPGITDPGNSGTFVSESIEDGRASVTGINGNYGNSTDFANSCGLIFQREAAGVVEAIGPQVQVTKGDVSVIYQGDVILGRLALGADFVNPAACVELIAGAAVGSTGNAKFGDTYPANTATS